MMDDRVIWLHGEADGGPCETIGVLEIRPDGSFRIAFAERAEVNGRCHVLLARRAWGSKPCLDTRWYSLVLDLKGKIAFVRNGSCGDPVLTEDVPRIIAALSELDLLVRESMIVVDDGPSVFPRLGRAPG